MIIKAKLKKSKITFPSIYDPIHLDSKLLKAMDGMLISKINNNPSKPRQYEKKD